LLHLIAAFTIKDTAIALNSARAKESSTWPDHVIPRLVLSYLIGKARPTRHFSSLQHSNLTHSLTTTTCFIMTPKYTAVTLGTVETDDDRKLNLWTAEAKFDLTPFISDGDVVDKEIQELDARLARAKAELERMRSGDLSHPAVRVQYEAKMLEQQVQIYLESE
jgi:hypothetical protein